MGVCVYYVVGVIAFYSVIISYCLLILFSIIDLGSMLCLSLESMRELGEEASPEEA